MNDTFTSSLDPSNLYSFSDGCSEMLIKLYFVLL